MAHLSVQSTLKVSTRIFVKMFKIHTRKMGLAPSIRLANLNLSVTTYLNQSTGNYKTIKDSVYLSEINYCFVLGFRCYCFILFFW
jgi:hypothetical protein